MEDLTIAGEIFGTTVYMSPEQARGEELDARSDLFSLGVVLYEMATGHKPFRKNNSVTSMNALLNEKPPAPRKLNPRDARGPGRHSRPGDGEGPRQPLPDCAGHEGRPAVAEEGERAGTYHQRPNAAGASLQAAHRHLRSANAPLAYLVLLGIIALLLTILIPVGAYYLKHRPGAAGAKNTIAVLPLRNLNSDISVDFLRFALADELSNTLAQNRSLDVRPSSMTQKYSGNDVDPQKAARELHVATIVTGHFVERGDNLVVTLEAIQASDNRLIWQTTFTAPAQDLIALQSDLSAQVRQGLLPILGVAKGAEEAGSRPKNPAGLRPLSAQPGHPA